MAAPAARPPTTILQQWVCNVMFEADTRAGKLFDEVLISARNCLPASAIGNSEPPFGHGLC